MNSLRADGLPCDDFCLTSLLHAYSDAKPRQRQRAEAVSLQAPARVSGRAEAEAICSRCGIDSAAVEVTAGKGGEGWG